MFVGGARSVMNEGVTDKIPLFKSLSAATRAKLLESMSTMTFSPGAYICRQVRRRRSVLLLIANRCFWVAAFAIWISLYLFDFCCFLQLFNLLLLSFLHPVDSSCWPQLFHYFLTISSSFSYHFHRERLATFSTSSSRGVARWPSTPRIGRRRRSIGCTQGITSVRLIPTS